VGWFWHTSGMARLCRVGFGFASLGNCAKFWLWVMGVVLWSGAGLEARQAATAQEEPIHTLHVYTNVVQVPTLVLTMTEERVSKSIAESRFSVSIDSGRWFRATHVRQEGDDPISLSILLDVSGDAAHLMPKIGDALGRLAPVSLHPRDQLSIYALDCSLRRSLHDAPADSVSLQKAVDAVVEPEMLRKRNKQGERCESKGHLWDGLAGVAVALSQSPGRRVILVVTDGRDTGSRNSWNAVRWFAQARGIAIFALNFAPVSSTGMGGYRGGRGGGYLPSSGRSSAVESPLISVCELTGGVVMRMANAAALPVTLEGFVKMLRERYIVEFPRPSNSTAGEHGMEVKIDKGVYLIRPSGVSMPLPDPVLMSDPTTIQTGPSLAPEEGTRKMINKPQ
jgi:hypothetical protein